QAEKDAVALPDAERAQRRRQAAREDVQMVVGERERPAGGVLPQKRVLVAVPPLGLTAGERDTEVVAFGNVGPGVPRPTELVVLKSHGDSLPSGPRAMLARVPLEDRGVDEPLHSDRQSRVRRA